MSPAFRHRRHSFTLHRLHTMMLASTRSIPSARTARADSRALRTVVVRCSASPSADNDGVDSSSSKQSDSSAMFSSLRKLAGNRKGNSSNLVLASDNSEETWRRLDKRVNKYPSMREFTAIGTGGDSFKVAMVQAVERVVGSVHVECVSEKSSSKGTYTSVTVGPVWVETSDQVLQIYSAMKEDSRLKWFI